jgi:hypothetical protein
LALGIFYALTTFREREEIQREEKRYGEKEKL